MNKNSYWLLVIFIPLFFLLSCTSEKSLRHNLNIEYYSIAEEYMQLKDYKKAAEYYNKAMADRELYSAAVYKCGRAYALDKDWEPAERIFRELLKKDPGNKDLRISLAYITAMNGKPDVACDMYRALTEEYPEDPDLLKNYITLLYFLERDEEAQNLLRMYKEKFPDRTDLDIIEKALSGGPDSDLNPPPPESAPAPGFDIDSDKGSATQDSVDTVQDSDSTGDANSDDSDSEAE